MYIVSLGCLVARCSTKAGQLRILRLRQAKWMRHSFLLNAGVRETATMSESLIRAAEFGHTAVALLLLDGANREAKHTALVYACGDGHTETARRLLEARSCDDSHPSELLDALLATARRGHLETMQLFLEDRVDVAEHYDAALFAAASHGPRRGRTVAAESWCL